MFGLAQLGVIEATTADKVKALTAALEDGVQAIQVIAALKWYREDASLALPQLKKLKLSPDDDIRKAATEAIKVIE